MKMFTASQLVRRSESDLSALYLVFNSIVAQSKPFSAEWTEAVLAVELIHRERKRRLNQDAPRP